ncbi:metallophosphoesterase [uncultured Campylobacter sp.]|uniref:metallophosphoesterase n=1 Tax=uncultured Campylobacter sp. TaxID=218934 RepID=UPI0025DCF093|nr:metallophosphoesterase [uncultured Campylobacter sp.]
MLKIKRINESDFERIFVFGDLHGCLGLFDAMLEKINLTKNDLIVILGDSCDRGEDSIGLYLRYAELIAQGRQILHVRGNHEDMLYKAIFEDDAQIYYTWINNGGEETIKSAKAHGFTDIPPAVKEFIEQMPHIISSEQSIFVHAAYNPKISLERQDEDFVMWRRAPFWQENDAGKKIYFGHTPNRDNEIHDKGNGVFAMDCGAVFFGRLVIIEIKSGEKFEVGLRRRK